MKKSASAVVVLAVTMLSGNVFALSADFPRGLQVSNDAVMVSDLRRPVRHYHRCRGGCATGYAVLSCGPGCRIAYWSWGVSSDFFSPF